MHSVSIRDMGKVSECFFLVEKSLLIRNESSFVAKQRCFLNNLFLLRKFTSYWNIPSFACSHKHKLPLLNVTQRYEILQNADDNFRLVKMLNECFH